MRCNFCGTWVPDVNVKNTPEYYTYSCKMCGYVYTDVKACIGECTCEDIGDPCFSEHRDKYSLRDKCSLCGNFQTSFSVNDHIETICGWCLGIEKFAKFIKTLFPYQNDVLKTYRRSTFVTRNKSLIHNLHGGL